MNVGGAGRIVSKIFGGMYNDATDIASINNGYLAQAPAISVVTGARQMGILTSNVRVNDKYLYPLDRRANAIHFHDVTSTEANPPNVSRDMYSGGGDGLTTEFYNGVSQTNHLKGLFYYQAHRLNRNERINSRGIEYEQQYSLIDANTYTCRLWLEIVKQATLTNGILDINFA